MRWAAAFLVLVGVAYLGYEGFSPDHHRSLKEDELAAWLMPLVGGLAVLAGILVWFMGRRGKGVEHFPIHPVAAAGPKQGPAGGGAYDDQRRP